MDRPTFSNSWSRVNQLTPTLRPQVQVRRRLFRGEPWYVLHDPLGNQFSRINPVSYYLIGLLDGKRTVEQAWEQTLKRFGDDAPTQGEVIGLLSQLNQGNLLRVDMPADAQPLLQRRQRQQVKQWTGQAMSILFIRVPLFNPDRMLKWLLPLFRPLLSTVGLILWAIWMVIALAVFLPHLPTFFSESSQLLSLPANWGWMMLVFIAIKAFHELGHGLICRRFGGGVYEAGIMMLVLFPCPYMDTTTAWGFDNRWKRMLVGCGGMIFELAVAGIAVFVWVYSSDDLIRQLAHNLIFIASVGTLLFNGNPLMRFDGYFILSDLIDIPNLYERATNQLKWLCQRYLYRLKGTQPPSSSKRERTILTVYGTLALLYRMIIMFGIVLFIVGFAFTLGIALALWTIIAWIVIPTCKFIHWLGTSSALHQHRGKALMSTFGIAVGLFLLLCIWPMPDHRRAVGVIEASQRATLYMHTPGFVQEVFVESGDYVEKDQVIFIADNPQLRARKKLLAADIESLEITRRETLRGRPGDRMAIEGRIQVLSEELAEIERHLERLTVRSPIQGVIVGDRMQQLEGHYIQVGKPIAEVVDPTTLRVTALVSQAHNSLVLLNNIEHVELRTRGRAGQTFDSQLLRAFDSGRFNLPHPALSVQGGGVIPVNLNDRDNMNTDRPYFHIWLALPSNTATNPAQAQFWPGQRVYVRMTLEQRKPLAFQWIHQLQQIFDERLMW